MSEAIASRYAEALYQLGNEKDSIDQFFEELRVARGVFLDNEQLKSFLKHPRITIVQKKQLLEEVFHHMHRDIINTLKLLVERERTEITPSIIDHFFQMVNDAKGITEAKVYSVRELTDLEKDALSKSFAKKINKQTIKINNIIDPSLIGGLKIRVGNTVYDGSVSGKLKRIERNIIAASK